MPSEKHRSMNDTWSPEELAQSMKDPEKSRRRERDRDKDRKKDSSKDKDRKERKHRDRENGDADDKRHRSKHGDDDDEERRKRREERRKERKREERDDDGKEHRKHRDKEDRGDREKRHRDKRNEDGERERKHRSKDEDGERRHRRRDEGEEKHRSKDDDKEHRRRRHREEGEEGESRRHRRDRDKDDDGDKGERRRHRDKDDKKHRRDREKDEDDGEKRHHRRRRDKHHHEGDSANEGDDSDRERRRESRRERRRRHGRHDDSDDDERGGTKARRGEGADDEGVVMDEEYTHIHVEDQKKSSKSEPEVKQESDDGNEYNYDDEEFEDYEDDFEDDVGDTEDNMDAASRAEMAAVLAAMNEENDRVLNRDSTMSPAAASPSQPARPSTASKRSFINFVSAKQRAITAAASDKTRRRGQELLQLIERDVAKFDLFDMPPMGEYELFMCSYGRSDTKQAYVQTNADNIERDVQTEEPDVDTKWCQHPPEGAQCCGGSTQRTTQDSSSSFVSDSVKLHAFIDRAAHVMIRLLEEEFSSQSKADSADSTHKSNIRLSEDYVRLGGSSQLDILAGRTVVQSTFSPTQSNLLLLVYSFSQRTNHPLHDKGLLCVWNVNEPSTPHKYLMSETEPVCACFSPSKSTLVIAGMRDGSLCLWDLTESNSLHKMNRVSSNDVVYRFPTYSTAGVLHYDNHNSVVRSLCPMVMNADVVNSQPQHQTADQQTAGVQEGSSSFQLASIEEGGTVNLWVVAELSKGDISGSQSDLGLSPGGKVKLIKSSSLQLTCPLRELGHKSAMKLVELALLPTDTNHFYVTTDLGCVIHGVQHGGKSPPRGHYPDIDTPVCITSIDFSPFGEEVFLVGCDDGTLMLYHIDTEYPLLTLSNSTHHGSAVHTVRWCRSRPSVVFVLDALSYLHTWDLCMSIAEPLSSDRVIPHANTDDSGGGGGSSSSGGAGVCSLALSNDHAATGIGVPGRIPQMAISLSSGHTDVHTIAQQFSALMPQEIDQFSALLQTLK